MKNILLNSLILAALAVPGVAMAEGVETTSHKEDIHVIPASEHTVTANVGFFSNYLYRGISQTGAKPAIQGGIDYAHASGFYVGAWGSNISWLSDAAVATAASLELDTYAGYKSGFATDFTYDVGFLRYSYPGIYAAGATTGNTNEIYGAVGWKWITAKYSRSLGQTFGVADAKGTSYIDLSASYPVADTGVSVSAHYGKQTYTGATATAATYSDYKLGATKDFSGYVLGLVYSKTNANSGGFYTNPQGKDLGKATAVLSVTHSF